MEDSLTARIQASASFDWRAKLTLISGFDSVDWARSIFNKRPHLLGRTAELWFSISDTHPQAESDIESQFLLLTPKAEAKRDALERLSFEDVYTFINPREISEDKRAIVFTYFQKYLHTLYLSLTAEDLIAADGEAFLKVGLSAVLGREYLEKVLNSAASVYDTAGDMGEQEVANFLRLTKKHKELFTDTLQIDAVAAMSGYGAELLGRTEEYACFDEEALLPFSVEDRIKLYAAWRKVLILSATSIPSENDVLSSLLEDIWN